MGRLLVLCCLLLGCKTPESVVVIREGEPCLFVPPPRPKPVDYRAGQADGGCAWVSCLDGKNADALGDNLEEHQRWEREAWFRCGPFFFDAGTKDAGR